MLIWRCFIGPLAPSNAAGTQQGSWEVSQAGAFLHVSTSSTLLNGVFYSLQSRAIWAAPLMMAFVVGSETKTETCIGRRRPIRQVIEGQGSFVLFWVNQNEKSCVLLLTRTHTQTPTHTLSSTALFYSITGQDENYIREVVCRFCRLKLCSTKRCKWEVDYATRQWYLWLTLNGNTTLFFLGFRRGENVMDYVARTE